PSENLEFPTTIMSSSDLTWTQFSLALIFAVRNEVGETGDQGALSPIPLSSPITHPGASTISPMPRIMMRDRTPDWASRLLRLFVNRKLNDYPYADYSSSRQ